MAKPIALVTGASSGIGAAYARRLARDGYDLVLVARRADRLKALAEELGGAHGTQVQALAADLGDRKGLKSVEDRLAASPPVELLVNNAGFGVFAAIENQDPDVIDEMVAVNVLSVLRLTRAVVPGMLARGHGVIINVCSGSAFFPMSDGALYQATKSLVFGFTRGLHLDVGPRGIQVQALVPGLVATEFFIRASGEEDRTTERPGMVMKPDDLVEASMAGLKAGEMVCIPSLPDYEAWRNYEAAEMGVLAGVSKDHIADRYRS
jgi:short-subunit dehydrogenase